MAGRSTRSRSRRMENSLRRTASVMVFASGMRKPGYSFNNFPRREEIARAGVFAGFKTIGDGDANHDDRFQNTGDNSTGTVVIWDLATGGERIRAKGRDGVRPGSRSRMRWLGRRTGFASRRPTLRNHAVRPHRPHRCHDYCDLGKTHKCDDVSSRRQTDLCDLRRWDGLDLGFFHQSNRRPLARFSIGDPRPPRFERHDFRICPRWNSVALNTANSALVIWDTKTSKERTRLTGESSNVRHWP